MRQETLYVAGGGPIAFACGPEPHPLVPTESPDPEDPAWLFSGEPECAAADLHNDMREVQGKERAWHGFGAARHEYTAEHDGSVAMAVLDEPAFGSAGFLTVSAYHPGIDQTVASEGCGPQWIILPNAARPHWLTGPTYWWAFPAAVGITDDLDVCFATTGILHATWGE